MQEKIDDKLPCYSKSGRIFASAFGGVLTSLIMTPLDVIKVRMQAASRPNSRGNCFIYCNGLMDHLCACVNGANVTRSQPPLYCNQGYFKSSWVGYHSCHNANGVEYCIYHYGLRNYPYSGVFRQITFTETISKLVQTEGVFSLWSGLSPTLVMALPQTIIYYSLNDWIKDRIHFTATTPCEFGSLTASDFIPPIVGALSRIVAVFVISPLELMRTKLQSKPMSLANFANISKSTVSQSGIKSLWTGLGPTLLRDIPYSAMFWFVYDYNKGQYLRTVTPFSVPGTTSTDFLTSFFFGSIAGFTAGVLTHPFDVIKTHRQLELGEAIFGQKKYPKSTWNALRHLHQQRGFKALFSGFTPRLLKTTTASALMVSIFELVKHTLKT